MRYKLLLADDSVTIQRVVELTFSGEDIDVIAVSDGEQAIARIPVEEPDIVLADIAMPKKNGYDVAEFVKQHPTLSHVPVLLLAGAFEPVDEVRAKRVKSDGVLVKPFETHEVIVRVRELIERKASPEPAAARVLPAAQPAETPAAPPVAQRAESLDEYFDRLDAAFAVRGTAGAKPTPVVARDDRPVADVAVPTVDALLPPDPVAEDSGDGNVLADLFQRFFAVEQGEVDAADVRVPESIARIRRGNTSE